MLALIFCTTFLHYTQNMMENNYILLLTLTGLTFQYQWLRSGDRRALWIGSLALGANLLTRLTTGMDLLAVLLFLALVSRFCGARGPELRSRLHDATRKWRCRCTRFSSLLDRAVPILSLRFVLQHVHWRVRARTENAEPRVARGVSV